LIPKLVIDTSTLLAFYLPAEPYKGRALALLQDYTAGSVKLVVPTLTYYEVLNALSRAVRGLKRGQKISCNEALEILEAIRRLKLEEMNVAGLEKRILEITAEYQRSAYDASYLALAENLDADLITGDERFYNAVKANFPKVKLISEYIGIEIEEHPNNQGGAKTLIG